jgi:hypothetical protein
MTHSTLEKRSVESQVILGYLQFNDFWERLEASGRQSIEVAGKSLVHVPHRNGIAVSSPTCTAHRVHRRLQSSLVPLGRSKRASRVDGYKVAADPPGPNDVNGPLLKDKAAGGSLSGARVKEASLPIGHIRPHKLECHISSSLHAKPATQFKALTLSGGHSCAVSQSAAERAHILATAPGKAARPRCLSDHRQHPCGLASNSSSNAERSKSWPIHHPASSGGYTAHLP